MTDVTSVRMEKAIPTNGGAMTVADVTLALFSLFNSLRFLAYVPQIIKALKDTSGAEAISFGTWGLFLASHLTAMAYALVNVNNWTMAVLFLSNAIGCAAVLGIAGWKRAQHRRRRAAASSLSMCGEA
jgi:hypothetical protein